jgi:catechol 2,3-dioxygenase-like lactoylglutathione lyase family enzyme
MSDFFKTGARGAPSLEGMEAQLDVIGIAVEDMARSLAFYRRLGFDLPPEADDQPHVETSLPGGLRLAWDTVETIRSFHPEWEAPSGGQRMSLAFKCESPAGVDAAYEELVAAGYTGDKEPWDAFWGQRYALVRDPDGNGVDLFAPS